MTHWKSTCLTLLGGAAGAVLLTLSGGSAVAGEFDDVTLRVGTWGGSWRKVQEEYIVPQLTAKGMNIEFVTASPHDNLAKLVAARGRDVPIDVMEIGEALLPLIEEGKFNSDIDLGLVPNKASVPASIYDQSKFITLTSQTGICYQKQKFADNGIPVPKTFQDLTHPKLQRKISIPDITSGAGLQTVAAIAYAAGGDIENVAPGLKLIKDINPFTFWKRGSANVTHMETGDIYAAIVHAGWCVRMKNAGLNVSMSHPKIDDKHTGTSSITLMIVLKGTKNPKAATAYLNEFLSEEFQFQLAKKTGVVPVNKSAIERMKKEPLLQEMMVLDQSDRDRMLTFDFSKINVSEWTDSWSRIVSN